MLVQNHFEHGYIGSEEVKSPMYRYFARIEDDAILSVFRFMFDENSNDLIDEVWINGSWQDSDGRIVNFLFNGDTNIDEIGEKELKEVAPELFEEVSYVSKSAEEQEAFTPVSES